VEEIEAAIGQNYVSARGAELFHGFECYIPPEFSDIRELSRIIFAASDSDYSSKDEG